jgi:hypothetical protein
MSCEDAHILYALLDADTTDPHAWTLAAVAAIERALDGDHGRPR